MIERESHARARGAAVLATLAGWGLSSDAFHWTQPSLEGAVSAMRQAAEAADIRPGEQVLISAHGTGTELNDVNEAQAVQALFGAGAANCPVIGTKSAQSLGLRPDIAIRVSSTVVGG